jgi:SAM-dependent methyltransferase
LPEFNLLPVEQACRFYLTSAYHHPKAQLLCLPEFLPFADKSMDIVIAPHVLENSDNPHQTLREIERILIPEGFLILSGINARSLWRFQKLPWHRHLMSLARLKDWLKLMNFECIQGKITAYVPPFASEKMIRRLAFLDRAGDRWWPLQGGLYCLVVKKRIPAMTPIRLASRWRAVPAAGKLVPIPERGKYGQ